MLRASQCKAKEDFLVNVRLKLVDLLLKGNYHKDAKKQLDKYLAQRKTSGYGISYEIRSWLEQDWYKIGREHV